MYLSHMNGPNVAGYGSWKSPITADLIVKGSVGLTQPSFDGEAVYWLEMRPSEAGRNVIVRRNADGELTDINPQPFNARTRVHEYGGGDYLAHKGAVFFSNFKDQRLYAVRDGLEPQPITSAGDWRYAALVMDERRNRLICVCEDHSDSQSEPINYVAAVNLAEPEGAPLVLVSGKDFYGPVRLSSDGNRIAWLSWNHPNMPWDGTELWLGEFSADGSIANAKLVAGGENESILQPEWSPDGDLYFVSDRTGWWNLYRLNALSVQPVFGMDAELGTPQWVFGLSNYAFANRNLIACSYIQEGFSKLALINAETRELNTVETPYSDISHIRADAGRVVFRAGSPTKPPGIVLWNIATNTFEVLRHSNSLEIDDEFFSPAQAIEFPTEGGLTAHGFYYPPKNPDYVAPAGELPPLLVKSHGGPTSAAVGALNMNIQFWTSRGIAVLDVNYGGSSGFGREYRDRLKDSWGVVDVDDCANGARYLVERGEVDGNRLMITGGSAGGYTTLCALTFRDVFKAGASHYGVSDAEALAMETHKFESRYLDGLFGPYPEEREVYRARSPINFTDQLSCPVIFFQGLEDKVVPPNQAEVMVSALKEKGIPVAYVAFEGEQHGFRRAKNIKRAMEGELYFYSQVFGFKLAEPVETVKIENL